MVIRAADLNKMVSFYLKVIGCTIDRRRDELGLVHLRVGKNLIDLISVEGELGRKGGGPPVRDGRNMDHLCLRIEAFDERELRSHFEAHGISASEVYSNYGAEGDGPSIYINDPEGNLIELKGPPTPKASGQPWTVPGHNPQL